MPIDEPSVEETVRILKGLQRRYEEHHHVRYTDEAIDAAARLAARHLRDLRLPDSAIDLLDEAGAMTRIEAGDAAASAAGHERLAESDEVSRTDDEAIAFGDLTASEPERAEPPSRVRDYAVRPDFSPAERASEFAGSRSRSREPAVRSRLPSTVDVREIERIVARMANIPDRQASASDKHKLRTLEESLGRVVFGQEEAVHLVASAIKRSSAGLGQPDRPAGCFLFTGPTGVGKTELAKQLAIHLGNEFMRYDMSEYMEKHAVARLVGAPPGYVGFEQGGLLVDAVRNNPYSVVLMDEIEKAHPDVLNILLQVMDHATLTDNNGRKADFRHVVLIMTSNAGSRELSAGIIGFGEGVGDQAHRDADAPEERRRALEVSRREDVHAGVPQPARCDRHVQTTLPCCHGDDRQQVHPAARGAARRAADCDHARARGSRLAGCEGIRSGVRRAAARPRHPA